MNISEAHVPLQTMLDIARQQPDYNHAFPILEVILTHFMGSPGANEAIRLVNEVKASFRKSGTRVSASPASPGNMPQRNAGGRPKRAGTPVGKAFVYGGESVRLGMLCQALRALGWIDTETDVQLFIDMFNGGEAARRRVIWKGGVNTLAELFRRLVNERGLVKLPQGLSLWVMVNGHFWENERRQEFGNDRLRSTHPPKGDDQTIAYLVNILDENYTLEDVRMMLENQR